jgi:N-acetylglutamate synthase-like GNAT family acetyltransferase
MPRDLGPDVTEDVHDRPVAALDHFAPLRVWLEPGYDGRVGGWVSEVPGVLVVADTPERALSAALAATGRVREWLEAHGDEAAIARIRRVEVAGEVPTIREPDGYEVMAILPPDRRRVTQDEVDAAIRRMGWAREDLLGVLDKVEAFESANGTLPTMAERGERTPHEVARHVAGAEVWLIGRLAGGGRYDGPLGEVAVSAVLAATRAWAVARLRDLGRADDGAETADRHGEAWTLAKVLRRLQAHAFDHQWELERRLIRVDGTKDRVVLATDRRPDAATMVSLLRSVGWDLRASEPASLGAAIANTQEFATAWDGERLIGTARSITDGGQNALIATVVVHPAYQGLGVGEQMVHLLTDGRDTVRFSLTAASGLDVWYRKLGFIPDPHAMYLPRKRR